MALWTLVLYLLFQLALCFLISRKIKTESEYLVAGRGFSAFMISVSLFATWFGAETCIGSSAAVYSEGLSGSRADPLGYGLCLILMGILIAGKVWSPKYMTLSDFYQERFGNSVAELAVWVISFSSLIWAAAQIRAFGQIISATTQLDLNVTLLVGLGFVLAYTLLGGLKGDVITDVIQAAVVLLGLLALVGTVGWNLPDLGETLRKIPAERLSMIAPKETLWERVDRWAIPVLGSLVAQEVISRVLASKNRGVAVRSSFMGAGIYLFFGLIPVCLGLIGPQLIESLEEPEQFLIQLAQSKLSPVLFGIFAGALISALLSTIDSILLACAALIGHGFLIPRLRIRSEKGKLRALRAMVLLSGVAAYALATHSEGIYELLESASSFGTAGVLVITLAGLWSRVGSARSALAALVVGVLATPLAKYVLELTSPFLFSIAAAALAYALFAIFERRSYGEPISTA